MKKILLLLFSPLVFLCSLAQENNFVSDTTKIFYFSYPENWESEQNTKPDMLLQIMEKHDNDKDQYRENMSVVVEDFGDKNYSLKKYSEAAESSFLKYLKKPNVYKTEHLKLSGKDAKRIFIDGKIGKFKLSFVQYYIVFNRKAYIITYGFEEKKKEKYLLLLNEIMKSFRFK